MDVLSNTRPRQALGRGLGALIPGAETPRELFFCPIEDISPAVEQPRIAINPATLQELADSIRQSGVLQPVLLRREGVRYRLVAGERRWRAARMAGLTKIPAMVKELDDAESFALALIENIQREDLSPLEEAMAYRRLIDDHGYTQQTLADKVGKARSTLANILRLLDLPESVQAQVAAGHLTPGHARAVLAVPAETRESFARELLDAPATVRQAEDRARPLRHALESKSANDPPSPPRMSEERRANLAHIERRLRESLGCRVVLSDHGGRGRLELFYEDDDMLQTIVDRLLE